VQKPEKFLRIFIEYVVRLCPFLLLVIPIFRGRNLPEFILFYPD
jgi:hypothetical protein